MTYRTGKKSYLEVLEARIAPATILAAGHVGQDVVSAVSNSATYLTAGQTLSTQNAGGTFLMYVESGSALVFSTDLNKNGVVDPNEITGVAAGNGLSLISYVDIHGDIVNDLNGNGTLSDFDKNQANNPLLGGDGRVLLNTSIAKIELRSLTTADLSASQDGDSDIDSADVSARLALSSYSIFGNIFAGSGFGTADGTKGLIIDTTGTSLQAAKFVAGNSNSIYVANTPSIGSIYVGTAGVTKRFSFGASDLVADTVGSSAALNVGGTIGSYTPTKGAAGGSINGVSTVGNVEFNIDGLYAGDGYSYSGSDLSGSDLTKLKNKGGAGGSVLNVIIGGDKAGGYTIKAGNGGLGGSGGIGGFITNFSDLGTSTGRVKIETGDGGAGTGAANGFGVGGNGGKATFATMNILGNLSIKLGDGGDGYHFGGAGRSLQSLNLTTGEAGQDGVSGLNIVSTWKKTDTNGNGDQVRTSSIDFNGDGSSDYVFTTTSPNQLTVEVSSATGFTRIDLAVSGTPASLTVGDFNKDGRPDIAVAYNDAGGTAGIAIYTAVQDGNMVRFSEAQTSAIPHLLTSANGFGGYFITGQPITGIVAGDFNRDGVTDIAASAVYTTLDGEQRDIILDLQGDGTGKVFADFSNKAVPFIDVQKHNATAYIQMQAAALAGVKTTEVLFYGVNGSKEINIVDFSKPTPGVTTIGLGQVDTDRDVIDDEGKPAVSGQDATLQGFTVGDLNGDGKLDLVALVKSPAGFLVTFTGDGTANGFNVASGQGNQGGILLVGDTGEPRAAISQNVFQANDLVFTQGASQLGVYGVGPNNTAVVYQVTLSKAADETRGGVTVGTISAASAGSALFAGRSAQDISTKPAAFDTFIKGGSKEFAVLVDGLAPSVAFTGATLGDYLGLNGVRIEAGAGGSSDHGVGGKGGTIGGAVLGSVTVDGAGISASSNGTSGFHFTAGRGGDGYLNGGAGGNLTGLRSLAIFAELTAGDGGDSTTKAGGAGGTISNSSIENGDSFTAGDGGNGKKGGAGGAVLGKGDKNIFDTSGGGVVVEAGAGGNGSVNGGVGGSVLNFINQLDSLTLGGLVSYSGGDGGNGGTGAGGKGGSVVNTSPLTSINKFGGEIFLKGGEGGSGATGGAGGKIKNFLNQTTEGSGPSLVTVLAGNGGAGTDGAGGAGGNVIGVTASGSALDAGASTPQADVVLAGAGGEGATKGGTGGSISTLNISAAGGAVVLGAGAGGAGGVNGGAGGSVTSVKAASSQSSTGSGGNEVSKILVAAGAGGDGGLADGGGKGGSGGSVISVKQTGNLLTNVDIIAGNGGSVTSGSTADSKVGKGGSITGVNLRGTLGDTSVGEAISSYYGGSSGYASFADFLATVRDDAASSSAQLTNSDGNVGLVAGASGLLNGEIVEKNGSVNNITASAIMSMVAGSVDNLAAIQSLRNVHIKITDVPFGTDKGAQGTPEYLDENGVPTDHPVIGGQLVDGAIFSVNVLKNNDGTKAPTSIRVFPSNA